MLKLTEEITTTPESKPKKRYSLILFYVLGWICAAGIAIAKIHFANPQIADDAYITLRYSYNLLHHGVFTYNFPSPQPTAAETSPLYGLLLTPLLHWFDPVRTFKIVMVASVASAAVLLYELVKREWGVVTGMLAALILLLNDYLYATLGMETSLFIFACLATILLLHSVAQDLIITHRKQRAFKALIAGIVFAIAVFIRGEAAILLLFPAIELFLGIGRNYRQAKKAEWLRLQDPYAFIEPSPKLIRSTFETLGKPLKTSFAFIFGAALISLPMAVFLETQTGRFIPGTLLAKEAQARSGFWGRGWIYYTGLQNFIKTYPWRYEIYALAILGVLGLLVTAFSRTHWKTRPLTLTAIGFALLQLIAYGNIFVVPFYHWYFGPQIIAVCALSGIAVGAALIRFRNRTHARLLAIPALALMVYFIYSSVTLIEPPGLAPKQAAYMDAAAWLKTHTADNATVAASEIGYIGYYSQRQMVDYVGLLNQQAANWVKNGNLFYWIYFDKPDYWIVHNPPWSLEEATKLPWFLTSYAPAATYGNLIIYRKVAPVPSLPASQQVFAQLSEVPWKS